MRAVIVCSNCAFTTERLLRSASGNHVCAHLTVSHWIIVKFNACISNSVMRTHHNLCASNVFKFKHQMSAISNSNVKNRHVSGSEFVRTRICHNDMLQFQEHIEIAMIHRIERSCDQGDRRKINNNNNTSNHKNNTKNIEST